MQSAPQLVKKKIGQFLKPQTPFTMIDKILFYTQKRSFPNLDGGLGMRAIFAQPGLELNAYHTPDHRIRVSFMAFYNPDDIELDYNVYLPLTNYKKDVLYLIQFIFLNYKYHMGQDIDQDYETEYADEYQHQRNPHSKVQTVLIRKMLHGYQPSPKIRKMIDVLKTVRPRARYLE